MNGSCPRLLYLCMSLVAALGTALAGSSSFGGDAPLVLENSRALLRMDPTFGTIGHIFDKSSGIELAPPGALADNFRLVLLSPDKTTATILGKEQKLSDVSRSDAAFVLRWKGPLKDTTGKEHAIAVRMEVKLADAELQFRLHFENGTDCTVRAAWYPLIGGLSRFGAPGKTPDGVLWAPTSTPTTKKIELPFGHTTFAYPGQANMSFACIESAAAKKSLYFASHDEIARYKVYHFQEQAKGDAKDVFACIEHMPFTPPRKTFDGSTVVLRIVDGDWHAAGQVYRAWFAKTFGICKPADCWIRQQSFFQMTMFELPEGTINFRFKDIPRWAKDARDHGINAVQISGWHLGGHDNGYPYYIVDPRLGTWQELEDGIKACHKMGLKVFFFVNYQQAMLDSQWYHNELSKYREHGPKGEVTWNAGWGMGTLWARMGHPKLMTGCDPAFPEYRKIIVDQFARLAQIGGDGVHVDKMFPAAIDYNPNLPMSPDAAGWEGAIVLTKEVFAACRKHNPDWAMSFECNWDRLLEFSGATWWVGNQRITRSVFPENAETLAISMAYDYLGVNNAVRDGHAVMLAPMDFSRSVGWKPWLGLADYIKEVKRIQDSLTETVFCGEVLGQAGVQLPGGATSGIDYNVTRNLGTGKRVCIFTNRTRESQKQPLSRFDAGHSSEVRIQAPFQTAKVVKLPAEIDVPAERIVFVEEVDHATFSMLCIDDVRTASSPLTEPLAALPPSDPKTTIALEDHRYRVEVNRSNGAITRIHDKQGGIELIREPRLADNFRFTLPIPGKEPWQTLEANYLYGPRQKLSSFDVSGKRLTLHWNKPLVNYLGEKFDASVTMGIELAENGIRLRLKIENPTPYRIGEVFFPLIGGIQGIGRTVGDLKATQLIRPTGADSVASADIFRVFGNMAAFGDQGPEQFYAYPKDMPELWTEFCIRKRNRSVYLGAENPPSRPQALRLELVPSSSGTVREDGDWPRPDELQGLPVGVSTCLVDFANAPAGKTYEAAPVLISFHDGDWHEAKRMYEKSKSPRQR